MLTYGSELHTDPSEEASRLAGRMARWICMGYKGSSRQKVEEITGIAQLEVMTHRKRVRWAASVYGRHEPELRPIAERILREELGDEVALSFMTGEDPAEPGKVELRDFNQGEEGGVGYTDGSRMEGMAAAATAESGIWLGALATVANAEMLGIAGAWEEGYRTVTSDSQTAIARCRNLASGATRAGSWIDEKAIRAMKELEGNLVLMWVKGHSGVEGNEKADERAKEWVMRGQWGSEPSTATPAGIRQAYPLFRREPHMKWNRKELRGLTYLHMDKGPMKAWLYKIGKAENPFCIWGQTQNSAHILKSGCVGGKRREWKDIWTDREFCAEVAGFLKECT